MVALPRAIACREGCASYPRDRLEGAFGGLRGGLGFGLAWRVGFFLGALCFLSTLCFLFVGFSFGRACSSAITFIRVARVVVSISTHFDYSILIQI